MWVNDPDQAAWEIYTVLADADRLSPTAGADEGEAGGCCGSQAPADADAEATATAAAGCC